LCEESEYTTQNQERSLWKHVRKNTQEWVDICSENDKDLQLYQQKLAVSRHASINFSLEFGLYILILHTRRKIRIFFEIDHISSKTCLLVLVYSMALLHQHLPDVLNVNVSL
jgi:hypothetical protein